MAVGRWALAVGRSSSHHHLAEGIIAAKVEARLRVMEIVDGGPPELIDVYVSPSREVYALFGVRLAGPEHGAHSESGAQLLEPPPDYDRLPHGRHAFERARHLFMECAVEGPLLNPEWGATRYSARRPQELK